MTGPGVFFLPSPWKQNLFYLHNLVHSKVVFALKRSFCIRNFNIETNANVSITALHTFKSIYYFQNRNAWLWVPSSIVLISFHESWLMWNGFSLTPIILCVYNIVISIAIPFYACKRADEFSLYITKQYNIQGWLQLKTWSQTWRNLKHSRAPHLVPLLHARTQQSRTIYYPAIFNNNENTKNICLRE